ncbi:MAG: hypothetical protein JOZ15_19760, partial [Acidobacteria bacterium]|nr:hypothetical protein [Acidobacteriota bacterium]
MEEARLNHLLRGLPREMAPAGFTAQVLRRLDDKPRLAPSGERPRRLPQPPRWHRLMMATATVGALGVSVGVSVAVLQHEHERSAMQLPALAQASATRLAQMPGTPVAAAGVAAAAMERTFRHESGTGELAATAGAADPNSVASRAGAATAIPAATASAIPANRVGAAIQATRVTPATPARPAIGAVQAY